MTDAQARIQSNARQIAALDTLCSDITEDVTGIHSTLITVQVMPVLCVAFLGSGQSLTGAAGTPVVFTNWQNGTVTISDQGLVLNGTMPYDMEFSAFNAGGLPAMYTIHSGNYDDDLWWPGNLRTNDILLCIQCRIQNSGTNVGSYFYHLHIV